MRNIFRRNLIVDLIMTYDHDKPRKIMIYGNMIARYGTFLSLIAAVVLLGKHNLPALAVLLLGPIVFCIIGFRVIRYGELLEEKEAAFHTDSSGSAEEAVQDEDDKKTVVCQECGTKQPSDREKCIGCGAVLH